MQPNILKKIIILTISNFSINSTQLLESISKYEIHQENITAAINSIETNDNSKLIACALDKGYISLFNRYNKDKKIHRVHSDKVMSLIITKDNNLITGSWDSKVKYIEIDNSLNIINQQDLINTLSSEEHRVMDIKNNANKTWAIIAISGNAETKSYLKLLNLKNLSISTIQEIPSSVILAIAIDNTEKILAISDWNKIIILDINTKKIIQELILNEENASGLIFDKNNNLILGLENGLIKIYDIQKNHIIKTLKLSFIRDFIYTLAIYKNYLVSGGADNVLSIWDLKTLKNISNLEDKNRYNSIYFLKLIDNNNYLAIGYSNGTIAIHSILNGYLELFKKNILNNTAFCDVNIITKE